MLSMVYVAFQQTNDMIEDHYYEREMKYQTLIDAAQNLNSITDSVLIKEVDANLLVQVPNFNRSTFLNGSLDFIRIENKNLDTQFILTPDNNGIFSIDKSKFSSGMYKVRIQWKSDTLEYYREQNIAIK